MYEQLIKTSIKYEKPHVFANKHVSYGTAGFRMKATDLDWILYRMGILACIRSVVKNRLFIGCMITASHNEECDNGCKLIDPHGEMLENNWESHATALVNSNDLIGTVRDMCENVFKIDITKDQANIAVAHDTRPSYALLLDAFKCGVEALNGHLLNYGLLSTPQLHYIIRCLNTNGVYGEPTEDGYFKKLSKAFLNITNSLEKDLDLVNYERNLYVDGANGVGAIKLNILSKFLCPSILTINIYNDSSLQDAKLNYLCGADHVKLYQKCPINTPKTNEPIKCCSVDGDADRVVYFYEENEKFYLLDGDKISTLIATCLKELIENAKLNLNIGIVQTAYANGNSTDYIENTMKIKAACVLTGVRHLHHKANEYDVGVYFEANGHGTVLFNENTNRLIDDIYYKYYDLNDLKKDDKDDSNQMKSIFILKNLKDCINQTIGDALSDILVVELILLLKNLNLKQWNNLYNDLPNRQLKVCVKDRNMIQTYDAERRVSKPEQLQIEIDKLIASMPKEIKARAFVRPSGTEDVVRVYAEAYKQHDADLLACKVAQFVYDLAGGIGKRPE